jgi:DNA repair protein RadA/Sms
MTVAFTTLQATAPPPPRLSSSFRGVDLVLGGGFVPGSTILLSGDPGTGKSTLLLQVAAYVGCRGYKAAYVTAEEAAAQVQGRAARLGLALAPVSLAATADIAAVVRALDTDDAPRLLVADSIQTMTVPGVRGVPGGPAQTKAVLAALIRLAHRRNIVVVVVSHVNKSSRAAGSNDLQHDVDAVLHLHAVGDRRVLRAIKNRHGSTAVVVQFKMTHEGVRE